MQNRVVEKRHCMKKTAIGGQRSLSKTNETKAHLAVGAGDLGEDAHDRTNQMKESHSIVSVKQGKEHPK